MNSRAVRRSSVRQLGSLRSEKANLSKTGLARDTETISSSAYWPSTESKKSGLNFVAKAQTTDMGNEESGKNVEVEVKLRINDSASYHALENSLIHCFKSVHEQENYFFTNDAMSAARFVLRVRFYDRNKKAVITVKGKQVLENGIGKATEEEATVDPEIARKFLGNPKSLAEMDLNFIAELRDKFDILNDLKSLGGFHNQRKEYEWHGHVLELDRTAFPWGTIYELECETSDPDQVRQELEEMFDKLELSYKHSTKSKFANFIEKTLE